MHQLVKVIITLLALATPSVASIACRSVSSKISIGTPGGFGFALSLYIWTFVATLYIWAIIGIERAYFMGPLFLAYLYVYGVLISLLTGVYCFWLALKALWAAEWDEDDEDDTDDNGGDHDPDPCPRSPSPSGQTVPAEIQTYSSHRLLRNRVVCTAFSPNQRVENCG